MKLEPTLAADRFFAPDPAQRRVAREIYDGVAGLPIVSPHGHVDPRLLADPDATFGTPTDLFIIPDHYILRMLYSQGIPLETLGVPARNGRSAGPATDTDHRRVWQLFADNFFLFRATPSGFWLADELREVFGIDEPLTSDNAGAVYDELSAKLARPEFRPRALFERGRNRDALHDGRRGRPARQPPGDARVRLVWRRAPDVPTRRCGQPPRPRLAGAPRCGFRPAWAGR